MLMFKKRLWVTEYSTRVQRMLSGEKLPPLRIDAEPHRRCDFRCVHCLRSVGNYAPAHVEDEVPEKRWYELARESGRMGVKSWNIAGICEPMLKPEMMMELMSIIKQEKMFGELTTNGWHWDGEHIKNTVDMGWDCVAVSIDGPDSRTHDAIRRVPGSFKRACSTVKRFSRLRLKRGSHLPNLTLNMVLNRHNHTRLPEMVRLTKKLGADVLFVEPMVAYSQEQRDQLRLIPGQRRSLQKSVESATQLAKKLNIYAFITCLDGDDEVKEFNPELAEQGGEMGNVILTGTKEQAERYLATGDDLVRHVMNIPCYYPWFYLMINAKGSAVHCGECTVHKDNIKEKSLENIWWGPHIEEFRENHAHGKLSDFCEKCRPNVIGDMKLVRKSIKEYSDVGLAQEKLVNMMEHALHLKRELYYSRHKTHLGIGRANRKVSGKRILDV